MKDENFEIIAVAQDTGGNKAADRFYEMAGATFTALIDVRHYVSSLYNMVNVPTAVWVNEDGRIVRQDDGAYTKQYSLGGVKFGSDDYLPALRDWVAKGDESVYALPPDQAAARLRKRTSQEAEADASFRLGVYFHEQGNEPLANKFWEQAQQLNPDSWNYHRQNWSFEPAKAMGNWLAKFRTLGDKPYYAPLDLPPAKAEE